MRRVFTTLLVLGAWISVVGDTPNLWPACGPSWSSAPEHSVHALALNDNERWRVQRYVGLALPVGFPVDVVPLNASELAQLRALAHLVMREPWLSTLVQRCCTGWEVPLPLFRADVTRCLNAADKREGDDDFACHVAAYTAANIGHSISDHGMADKLVWAWRTTDSTRPFEMPYLVKARRIANRGGAILVPAQQERHAGPLAAMAKLEAAVALPFAARERCAPWRGATSGGISGRNQPHSKHSSADDDAELASRLALVLRWFNATAAGTETGNVRVDVGFSQVKSRLKPALGHLRRPRIPLNDFRKCRYLLAPEGTDVATGLKWQLYTDSVVLMPPLTKESWALEGELQPWVHFVPVRPDWSDLGERLAWCEANLETAARISASAKAHIVRTLGADSASERRVVIAVLHAYQRALTRISPSKIVARLKLKPNGRCMRRAVVHDKQ